MNPFQHLLRRKGGVAIGLVLSLAAGLSQYCGWLDPLADEGLDFAFVWLGGIPADPRIALIDIDDSSIRAVGEYPWPRRYYADLVSQLNALGAQRVVLDILFTETAQRRVEDTHLEDDDLDAAEEGGNPRGGAPNSDDDELAAAILSVRAYLPMAGRLVSSKLRSREEKSGDHGGDALKEYFESVAQPRLEEFLEAALPPDERHIMGARRIELGRAFQAEAARRAWASRATIFPQSCADLLSVEDAEFPLEKFAAGAGIGFVAYEREKGDGVLRAIPMGVRVEDRIVLQLGVLPAMEALGGQPWALCEQGTLHLGTGNEERNIPLDADGLTLINWNSARAKSGSKAGDDFVHVPAARLLELADTRRAAKYNEQLESRWLEELMRTRFAETPAEFGLYAQRVRRLREIKHTAAVLDPARHPERYAEVKSLGEEIDKAEKEAMVWLERAHAAWSVEEPRDSAEREQRGRISQLFEWFRSPTLKEQVEETNKRLNARHKEITDDLRKSVGDKICVIGYSATGVADLVTTPVHAQAPGMLAHANVINMVLQDRFLHPLSAASNGVLVALAGLAAMLIGCGANWRMSLAGVLAIIVGAVVLGALLVKFGGIHSASLPAAAGAGLAWTGVTLYRQATEERARRRLQYALTQYTAPAIAAAIAERVNPDSLAPRTATVTCFFSDLDGFTRLSERLGPSRTRDVLNPYLEITSKILIEHGAIVNKFVGDGVFAFFNAPINPCVDHARKACVAARQLLQRCPSIHSGAQDGSRGEHWVRVGLSSGEVFVGDYGSQAKLDYTCIGDTVNLGSRLEQLNKFFDTRILLDGATRRMAGDDFLYRPLGLIQVHGRTAPAEVYEMVGAAEHEQFCANGFGPAWERAIGFYQACEWERCKEELGICLRLRPGDRPAALYLAAVERLRGSSPPEGWCGALMQIICPA